jgi:hypothetical protein
MQSGKTWNHEFRIFCTEIIVLREAGGCHNFDNGNLAGIFERATAIPYGSDS